MGRKGLVTAIFSRLVDPSPASSSSSSPGGARGGGQASPPWPWPSCGNHPQTASFRAGGGGDDDEEPCCTTARGAGGPDARLKLLGAAAGEMYKTVNSVYFDPAAADEVEQEEADGEGLPDDIDGFSTTTASEEWSEAVIRSLGRSTSTHRFFFDPGPPSNSILPAPAASAAGTATTAPPPAETPKPGPASAAPDPDDGKELACATSKTSLAEGSVAVAVDSADPYGDFRASMEEMVAAHGLRDWAALEELLSCYLRINAKQNHPLIVGAFVDLLVGLVSAPPSATTTTTATTTTSKTSSGKSTTSSTTSATSITTTATATATTTAAAATVECGVGNEEASCSSSSSSCATPDSQDAAEEKVATISSDDDIRHDEREHQCIDRVIPP